MGTTASAPITGPTTGTGTGAKLVAAIDQGTTSTRVIIFDHEAKAVASHQMEHKQHYPKDGWCEHDPMEILENTKECLERAVDGLSAAGCSAADVIGIGITNQRETTVVWDRTTGRPLHNAIVWLDLRTAELAAELEAGGSGGKDRFRAVCGLPISTYFSSVKLVWLMRHVPAVAAAVVDGRALFGTIDTWLIWHLSGGVDGGVHVTDVTNASRTMLMELSSCSWHAPTCEALGVPMGILPAIKSCSEVYARVYKGAGQLDEVLRDTRELCALVLARNLLRLHHGVVSQARMSKNGGRGRAPPAATRRTRRDRRLRARAARRTAATVAPCWANCFRVFL
jgi:glycerol kinase